MGFEYCDVPLHMIEKLPQLNSQSLTKGANSLESAYLQSLFVGEVDCPLHLYLIDIRAPSVVGLWVPDYILGFILILSSQIDTTGVLLKWLVQCASMHQLTYLSLCLRSQFLMKNVMFTRS